MLLVAFRTLAGISSCPGELDIVNLFIRLLMPSEVMSMGGICEKLDLGKTEIL